MVPWSRRGVCPQRGMHERMRRPPSEELVLARDNQRLWLIWGMVCCIGSRERGTPPRETDTVFSGVE